MICDGTYLPITCLIIAAYLESVRNFFSNHLRLPCLLIKNCLKSISGFNLFATTEPFSISPLPGARVLVLPFFFCSSTYNAFIRCLLTH